MPGPCPLPGHALAESQMGLAVLGRPRRVLERNEASWALSQCLSVPFSPHPPSRPWHSNQCPLTSHLATSVNQLKLARCHKNIYTFYAIGKFKSSSCALLPRKLHSTVDWTARGGGRGHRGQAGLGQLEQLCRGLCCPLTAFEAPQTPMTLALNCAGSPPSLPPRRDIHMLGGGEEGGKQAILRNRLKLLSWVLDRVSLWLLLSRDGFFSPYEKIQL